MQKKSLSFPITKKFLRDMNTQIMCNHNNIDPL